MKPKRVCIFADERTVHARRWVEGLRSLGIPVDLITLIKESEYDIGGISLGSRGKVSYLTKIGKLRSIVKKINPDIFHAHHASSFGFLASFVDHPAKVLSVWGYDVITFPYKNMINKAMIRRALNRTGYITATSDYLKQAVLKLNNSINNIDIIPFGVDTDLFGYFERKPSHEIVIGIAKSLRPKYGIDILIRAFGTLKNKYDNIKLKIAGKGEYESAYKNLVKDLGIAESVDFLGFVNHSKLPHLFSTFDIFVMPSIFDDESFGVAALEASATGLPVVASRVGGVPEVIEDNVTGYLIERKNVAELTAALEKLIEDPQLRSDMGKAGRKFVKEKYRWNDNLLAMNNLYEKILGGRAKGIDI
ncbi:MAG: glycosyltransferase family 4 protein [Candidatus Zixiibacteriota bacterium]|nr:MAG: glycosyltransferase family 4 protein [candidate division Zixibacteria bacterium]